MKALFIPLVAVALGGCMTIGRVALAVAPTAGVAANASVARHCVNAYQTGTPVDQRRQNRVDFAGIAYDMEVAPRTTTAQQEGVQAARDLRRLRCPPIPEPGALPPLP